MPHITIFSVLLTFILTLVVLYLKFHLDLSIKYPGNEKKQLKVKSDFLEGIRRQWMPKLDWILGLLILGIALFNLGFGLFLYNTETPSIEILRLAFGHLLIGIFSLALSLLRSFLDVLKSISNDEQILSGILRYEMQSSLRLWSFVKNISELHTDSKDLQDQISDCQAEYITFNKKFLREHKDLTSKITVHDKM